LMVVSVLATGCSSMSNLFDSKSADKPAAAGTDPNLALRDDDVECPPVTVRTGASTLPITVKQAGGDPNALTLRYQGTIVRTARECAVRTGAMHMKVGIEGRVILGPAGGPGQLDVPLRLAVVQEGTQSRAVFSKLIRIAVTVPDGVPFANFEYVEPEITFPLPRPAADIDNYVVYVGFDPSALTPEKPSRPRARTPKRN